MRHVKTNQDFVAQTALQNWQNTKQVRFLEVIERAHNPFKNPLDPMVQKVIDHTLAFYEERFNSSYDTAAVREFVNDKILAFSETSSYADMKEDERVKFIGLFAELCVSYKAERNPGWGYISTGRSAVWANDAHKTRAETLKIIDEMCSGSIKIVFGDPAPEVLMKPVSEGSKGCVFVGEKQDLVNLYKDTGVMAYALMDYSEKSGGAVYLGSKMGFNGPENNSDASLFAHEVLHILDLHGRTTQKDCINTIVSEYNSYKYQFVSYYGDGMAGLAAKELGKFLQAEFIDKKTVYHMEYENLSEQEKSAFAQLIADLKWGYVVPTDEFEKRLRG